jgi:translation initiation factor IF-2
MRARGAQVTDIAIIIIAADDNIMPQTKEAINHAVAANVPIVFAINKVDKPTANPEKIKESLAAMNFLVEDWGGKYQSQDISAKQGIGVSELLEKVLLEAEMLELKANPNRNAVGTVIESSLDKGRGYVATVLVSNGTLRQGDVVVAGTNYGRVKALFNERNQRVKEVGPSQAATLLGFNGAPQAGDQFNVMSSEQEAREIANKREQLQREQSLRTQKILTLDEIGRRIALGTYKELNIVVKGDVDGSVEALADSFIKLSTETINVNVIHKGVGQITENDVTLAAASQAVIVGFQVRPSQGARRLADREGVEIRQYSIIYDAIEEAKEAMEGMLEPVMREEMTAPVFIHRETARLGKIVEKQGQTNLRYRVRVRYGVNAVLPHVVLMEGATLRKTDSGQDLGNQNADNVGKLRQDVTDVPTAKHPHKFRKNALGSDGEKQFLVSVDRRLRLFFNVKSQHGGKAHGAQDPYRILIESCIGIADGADPSFFQIATSAEKVPKAFFGVIHDGVDGEIPPLQILE